MTEAEWLQGTNPSWMLTSLPGRVTDRKLRLYGVGCCRRVWRLLYDGRSRRCVEAGERFADGEGTAEQLGLLQTAASKAVFHAAIDGIEDNDGTWQAAAQAAASLANFNDPRNGAWDAAFNAARACYPAHEVEESAQAHLLRDIFGNPFRPITFLPEWHTSTVLALAAQMYESRDFSAMPVLADALQDAGCDSADALDHCRGPGPHVRGCWVVDLVLGKT